ncbi:competence protein CoiA family protein [Symbiobacterium terraclitae]|uniref:competence protein CoiA family protein n=1 Tax=Symbiobacterium terraclitae TaxID=557451 RepID=UPI004040F2F4
MEWAYDPYTGKDVHALDRRLTRRDYVCPKCRAPVRLRRGDNRRPHFAHLSGKADPACELYAPVVGSGQADKGGKRRRPYRSLAVYLRSVEGRGPLQWFLELGVPEPDSGLLQGDIVIPFALEGERTIPVGSIRKGGIRVRVRPDYRYNLVLRGLPETDWTLRCSQPIDGLIKKGITVFEYSPHGGRALARQRPLCWGRAYALIWESSWKPSWWPATSNFIMAELMSKGSWQGAIIRLPAEPVRQVQSWVSQCLDRVVEQPPVEIRLVSPPPERRLDDGSLVVSPDAHVLIGITGECGAQEWDQLCVSCNDGLVAQAYHGEHSGPVFYSLGLLPEGRTDIWVDDNIDSALQLVVSRSTSPKGIPEVTLFGRDSGNVEWSVPLDIHRGAEVLSRVRSGAAALSSIYCPAPVPVYVKWRTGDQGGWNTRVATPDPLTRLVPSDVVFALSQALTRDENSVVLDAGSFGCIQVDVAKRLPATPRVAVRDALKQRLLWLLSHTSRTSPAISLPGYERVLGCVTPADRVLIQRLMSARLPVQLLPQLAALLTDIQDEIRRNRDATSRLG